MPETAEQSLVDAGPVYSRNVSASRAILARFASIAPPILFAASLLAIWELFVRLRDISPLILPPPSAVMVRIVSDYELYLRHAKTTGIEVALGFLAATVIGIALGMLIASSKLLANAIYPVLIASQVTPKVAIAPLMLVWFGFGITSKVILTALIGFFPVVINTVVGLKMTTTEGVYLFRSMGASTLQTFVRLRFPTALPVIFSGLKIAATFAVIGAVVGEFTGARAGLGFLLIIQAGQLNTVGAFANIAYLTAMGLIMFGLVVALERAVVPSHMLQRAQDQAP